MGNGAERAGLASCRYALVPRPQPPPAVPISFTIEPTSGLLRTIVAGRFGRDDMLAYAHELRAHPAFELVERRLVDVRPSALVTADDLHDLLVLEHDVAGSVRRADRRVILLHSETGPALGRELVVTDRRHSGVPIAYRVFRSAAHAYRYLHVEPRASDRARAATRRSARDHYGDRSAQTKGPDERVG